MKKKEPEIKTKRMLLRPMSNQEIEKLIETKSHNSHDCRCSQRLHESIFLFLNITAGLVYGSRIQNTHTDREHNVANYDRINTPFEENQHDQ